MISTILSSRSLMHSSVSSNLLLNSSSIFFISVIVLFSSDLFYLYFLVLCWSSNCVPLLFSFSSVRIFMIIILNSLSGKFLISVSLGFFLEFYLSLSFFVIWNIFLCLFLFCDFLWCLYESRWNSNLSQFRRCVFLWEHPYPVCMCPVALVGKLYLKQAWVISSPWVHWWPLPWQG